MTTKAGVHEKGTFSISDLLRGIKTEEKFSKAGAIALFVGVTRGETNEGGQVRELTIEAYEEKANEVLQKICNDLEQKPGIVNVQIHHLLGKFDVGEDLVYVAVAGLHRKDVFPVLQEAVERYKHEAPIFKKEKIANSKGSLVEYWVSEK
ncbi:MAG: molybdenum cofactor biosynthesis protein MoaE [Candidatus Bathyarchaeia archaeon]